MPARLPPGGPSVMPFYSPLLTILQHLLHAYAQSGRPKLLWHACARSQDPMSCGHGSAGAGRPGARAAWVKAEAASACFLGYKLHREVSAITRNSHSHSHADFMVGPLARLLALLSRTSTPQLASMRRLSVHFARASRLLAALLLLGAAASAQQVRGRPSGNRGLLQQLPKAGDCCECSISPIHHSLILSR